MKNMKSVIGRTGSSCVWCSKQEEAQQWGALRISAEESFMPGGHGETQGWDCANLSLCYADYPGDFSFFHSEIM